MSRIGLENLPLLSCTDIPCAWREEAKSVIQKYKATPLEQVKTFKIKSNEIVISQSSKDAMVQRVKESLVNSAFTKHLLGRHEPIARTVKMIIQCFLKS